VPTISFNWLAILSPFSVAPKRSISGLSVCFFKSILSPITAPTSRPNNLGGELPGVISRALQRNLWYRIIDVFGEDHLDNPLLRLPLCSLACLRLDIEREPTAGMTHQFLHNLYILAVRDQERGVRMSKRVPADSLFDSGSSRRRLNDFQRQDVRPKWVFALRVRAGEYPIVGVGILARFLPQPEVGGHMSVEWNRLSRGFCFAVPDDSEIDGTHHIQLQA